MDNVDHNFATMQIISIKAPLFPMEASEKGASGSQISPGGKRSQVYLSKIRMYNGILGFIPLHLFFGFLITFGLQRLLFSTGHLFYWTLPYLLLCPSYGQQVLFCRKTFIFGTSISHPF